MFAIIGGSFAGLFAARALALKGWPVTVFEPDPAGGTEDFEDTFDNWNRPGVPQLRQPHTIRALGRRLLLDRDPELAADVLGCGALQWPYSLKLPGVDRVEDPDLIGIMARRTTFEPVIRRRVEQTRGVTFSRTYVTGLTLEAGPRPRVTGVRVKDGTELPFQCVIDASGRRTRVPAWLEQAGMALPAERLQPAGMIYYSRYFRFLPGVRAANQTGIRSGPAGTLPLVTFRSNTLDRDTFSMTIAVASWEPRFRALKHDQVFNAYTGLLPPVAAWTDPEVSRPISKVRAFGDIMNCYRDFLLDGRPVMQDLYMLGDARVHTSPYFGWGITIALKHGLLLADSFAGPSNEERQVEFERQAAAFSYPYYEAAADEDAARTKIWRGEELSEDDRYGFYIQTLTPAASRDPYVYREVYRRTNMMKAPDAIFSDADTVARAREAMKGGAKPTPSAAEVLAYLDVAQRAAAEAA